VLPPTGAGFMMALSYVAVSRACCWEDVTLLAPLCEEHFTGFADQRAWVHAEYRRLETLL